MEDYDREDLDGEILARRLNALNTPLESGVQKPIGNAGKRSSTAEPLTEHDVAERIAHAMMRLTRMLQETRQLGMMELTRHSRYWPTGLDVSLREELDKWQW